MSMISEQVKKLKNSAYVYKSGGFPEASKLFLEAADTIEALSTKLAAANMERSDMISKNKLIEEIDKEIDAVIVKDTYSKGKNAGLRKAKILAEEQTKENYGGGWQPISEYSRDKYDWVLIKYFDGEEECVPQVAELRSDGKWHVSTDFDGDFIIPPNFDVRYFFDMQQLDRS